MGNNLSPQSLQSGNANTLSVAELNQHVSMYAKIECLRNILDYVSTQLMLGLDMDTIYRSLVSAGTLAKGSEDAFAEFVMTKGPELQNMNTQMYTRDQVDACLLSDDVSGCLDGVNNVGQRDRRPHHRHRPPPRPIYAPMPVPVVVNPRVCDPSLAPFCTAQEAQMWLRRFGFM